MTYPTFRESMMRIKDWAMGRPPGLPAAPGRPEGAPPQTSVEQVNVAVGSLDHAVGELRDNLRRIADADDPIRELALTMRGAPRHQ